MLCGIPIPTSAGGWHGGITTRQALGGPVGHGGGGNPALPRLLQPGVISEQRSSVSIRARLNRNRMRFTPALYLYFTASLMGKAYMHSNGMSIDDGMRRAAVCAMRRGGLLGGCGLAADYRLPSTPAMAGANAPSSAATARSSPKQPASIIAPCGVAS